jgi:DNA-binding FrmR family transcriptional regulator
MTTAATLLTLIGHAQQHVTALESLVAGMTTGLRSGMVDADHMCTLMATQTRAINAQLDQVAAALEKAELRPSVNDSRSPPL